MNAALFDLPPGPFVPAGLPHAVADPDAPLPDDAAGAVGHLLAAAAAMRARMAWGRAETYAREAAELAVRTRIASLGAAALNEVAAARLAQGSITGVAELCERAERAAPDGVEQGRARVNLAVAAALAGRSEAALALLDEAAGLLPATDRWGQQLLRLNRVAGLLLAGELAAAQEAAADALRAARREREEHWTALAGLAGACVHRARGTRNAARSLLVEAARAFTRTGDAHRRVQCHYLLGEIAYEAEDPIRAGSHYRDGLAVAREAGAAPAVALLTLRFEHR